MKLFRKQKSVQQLPKIVKLFPLSEVMLLPQTQLPLNIFEKKYISMIDQALAGDRLIGMIQPRSEENEEVLHKVGCIGRITSFQEASKGQYQITLLGLCRFKLIEEINDKDDKDDKEKNPIRQAKVEYVDFGDDFTRPSKQRQMLINRKLLITSVKNMLNQMDLNIDWADLVDTPNEMLVNAISMTSPFLAAEKQALLEAPTVADRAELLVTLSKMSLTDFSNRNDLLQ